MAEVKVPKLLHKMSMASQKAWYKKHGMEMPSGTDGKSAAQAKKDVGEINKKKAREAAIAAAAATSKKNKELVSSSERVRAMRKNADAWGGGLGGGLDRNRDIISYVRAGGTIKAGRLGEEALDEGNPATKEKLKNYVRGLGVKATIKGLVPFDQIHSPLRSGRKVLRTKTTAQLKKEEVEQVDEVTKQEAENVLGGTVKEKPKMPPGKQPAGYRYVRGLARRAMKAGLKNEATSFPKGGGVINYNPKTEKSEKDGTAKLYDPETERMQKKLAAGKMSPSQVIKKMKEEVEQIDEAKSFFTTDKRGHLNGEFDDLPNPKAKIGGEHGAPLDSVEHNKTKDVTGKHHLQDKDIHSINQTGKVHMGYHRNFDDKTDYEAKRHPESKKWYLTGGEKDIEHANPPKYNKSRHQGGYRPIKMGEEVEQVDELKKSTLGSYVNKAANQVRAKTGIAASFETQGARKKDPVNKAAYMNLARDYRQGAKKRLTGIEKATARLAKEEVEQVFEQDDTMEKKEMAQTQLHFMQYAAKEILEFIDMGGEIEEWYQNKLSKVHSDMEGLHSYIEGEKRRTGMVKEETDEKNTNEALDPVGKEDKDIDNDGDTDKTDVYLHSKRKAIGKAIRDKLAKKMGK